MEKTTTPLDVEQTELLTLPFVGIVIPALDPDQRLLTLLQQLLQLDQLTKKIVVVDDGSASSAIFDQIEAMAERQVVVLHHEQNQGKGAALKTAFQYFLAQNPQPQGIATLDADGQHTVTALLDCLKMFAQFPDDLILGTRQFTQEIPFRSRFGNVLTNGIVRLLTRIPVSDTQTGLRVIPIDYVRELVDFPGQRFEFEFDMLLRAREFGIVLREQPIPTIYLDGNASSHFRVIRDSISIYSRFLKFSASGLISFVVDISLFALISAWLGNRSFRGIMVATIGARLLSAVVNYALNHRIVFDNAGQQTLIKYGALFLGQMLLSGILTSGFTTLLPGHGEFTSVLAKMIVDLGLFLLSYYLQKNYIFKERQRD